MNKLKEYFNSLNLQNKLRLCFIFFLILLPSLTIGIALLRGILPQHYRYCQEKHSGCGGEEYAAD